MSENGSRQSVRCVGIRLYHISKHRSKKPFPGCHIFKPPTYQSIHLTVPGGSVPSFRHSFTSPLSTFRQPKDCLHYNKQYFNSQQTVKTPSQQSVKKPNQQSVKKQPFHYSRKGVEGQTLCQDTEVPSYTACDCNNDCNGHQ